QDWITVHTTRPDLTHEVHPHRISAERKKGRVTQTEDARIAPNQINREGKQDQEKRQPPAVPAHALEKVGRHRRYAFSDARPVSGKRPCGRRWMKRISAMRTAIFASTAPA